MPAVGVAAALFRKLGCEGRSFMAKLFMLIYQ